MRPWKQILWQKSKGFTKRFGLEFTTDFGRPYPCLYLEKERDFKKNSYNFDDEQKAQVYHKMKKQFEQYHYKP